VRRRVQRDDARLSSAALRSPPCANCAVRTARFWTRMTWSGSIHYDLRCTMEARPVVLLAYRIQPVQGLVCSAWMGLPAQADPSRRAECSSVW